MRQHRYPGVEAKTAALLTLARKAQLPADPATVALWARRMRFLVEQLEAVNRELVECRRQREDLVEDHPDGDLFRSVKGVGILLAAGMICLFGEDRGGIASPTTPLGSKKRAGGGSSRKPPRRCSRTSECLSRTVPPATGS